MKEKKAEIKEQIIKIKSSRSDMTGLVSEVT
jgi:hypothetical protein